MHRTVRPAAAFVLVLGLATLLFLLEPEEGAVRVARLDDRVVVTNLDGEWTIYTRCVRDEVGPGYVARLETRDGRVLVDDRRGPGTLNDTDFGGLGAFGWHHARGEPGSLRFGRTNAWEVGTRTCARANGGFGVARTRVLAFGATAVAVEVALADRWTYPEPIVRVVYRYRFFPRAVATHVTVTELCPGGRCGATRARAFVKEPKLVAHVNAPLTDMTVLDDAGAVVCTSRPVGPRVGPILETTQCDAPRRERVRIGAELEVTARAAPGELWAESQRGLDAWAVAAAERPAAYPEDTASIDGVVWGCHGGSPNDLRQRRWELAGRRGRSLGVLLPAWEGGRGGYDCEPLARTFGPRGQTWTAYLEYALVR